jgi:hypothetical protein
MLISAQDIAKRDRMTSVGAWIRGVSGRHKQEGKLPAMWDGKTISGAPVAAFVDHGRILAQCDICGSHEYVDPDNRIFYCMGCGNNGSTAARPVEFPDDWAQIEAALSARPIVEGFGRDWIEKVMRSTPGIADLARAWRPGVSAAQLEAENKDGGLL